jgi:hypothetical protein
MTDRVRVVALGAAGTQCAVIYPTETLRQPGESDETYYPRVFDFTIEQWGAQGQPYIDTAAAELPPAPQEEWRLVEGQLVVVTLLPKESA